MRPRSNRRLLVVASVVVVVAVVIANLLGRHENRYERMADAITQALAHNDMAPVQKDFNAIDRPELQNRARVGALSDLVGAMGASKAARRIRRKVWIPVTISSSKPLREAHSSKSISSMPMVRSRVSTSLRLRA